MFLDMSCNFAFVTETWFSNDTRLEQESERLLLGQGLKLFTLDRPPDNAGFPNGGVAIVAKDSVTKLTIMDFPNPDNFEILTVSGTLARVKRKLLY